MNKEESTKKDKEGQLFYITNKDVIMWSKWKNEKECTEKEKEEANLRGVKKGQINLDCESKQHGERTAELLKKDKVSYERWDTGSRGEHFNIEINKLQSLNYEDIKTYREAIIKKYRCDDAVKKGVIARENKPHFKTGKVKTLIETEDFGVNHIDLNLVAKITQERKPTQNKQSKMDNKLVDEIKRNVSLKDILNKYGVDTSRNPTECKWHGSEGKKNFSYDEDLWNCFNCDKGGDIFTFVMEEEGVDFIGALNILKKEAGIIEDTKFEQVTKNIKLTFTSYLDSAERFHGIQPYFYDKSKMWWLWSSDKYCYGMIDETDILNAISKAVEGDFVTSKSKTGILEALRRIGREKIPLEPKKSWIQFKDKVVDVKTNNIADASPLHFITNPIPWEIGKTEETPIIDKILKEWIVMDNLQDESYINTILEIVAYSTLRHQFLQRLFAFTGSGSNGKGCFFDLLIKFLGVDNICTTELKLLTTRFESSALYRKQACLMGEVDVYDMKNTNLLKKLSGEDKIRYEFKGKTPFSDISYTTCFIATNALPITPDQSIGYYRRWLIVDFPHTFKVGKDVIGSIPDVEFNNLAKKCIRMCNELYIKCKFTNEGNVEERIKKYEERSNPINTFIQEKCNMQPELEMFFKDFCEKANEFLKEHRLRPMSKIAIGRALATEGYESRIGRFEKDDGTKSTAKMVHGLDLKTRYHYGNEVNEEAV